MSNTALRFIECPNLKDKDLRELAQKAMRSVNDIWTDILKEIDLLK